MVLLGEVIGGGAVDADADAVEGLLKGLEECEPVAALPGGKIDLVTQRDGSLAPECRTGACVPTWIAAMGSYWGTAISRYQSMVLVRP